MGAVLGAVSRSGKCAFCAVGHVFERRPVRATTWNERPHGSDETKWPQLTNQS